MMYGPYQLLGCMHGDAGAGNLHAWRRLHQPG